MDKNKKWLEIQAFAEDLVGLEKKDIDAWASHVGYTCPCLACEKFSLYTNIVDALEQWEKRHDAKNTSKVVQGS